MRVAKAYSWKCPGCNSTLKLPQVRHKCPVDPLPGSNELVQWWKSEDTHPEVLVIAHHGHPTLPGHETSHHGDGVKCPSWEHHHCSEDCEVEEEPVPDSDAWKTIPANKITMAGGIIYPLSGTIKFDLLTADDSESQAKQKLTKQMKQAQPVKDVPAHEKLAGQILTIAKSHGVPISEFVALEIARAAESLFGSSSEEIDHLHHVVDSLTVSNKHLIEKYKSSQKALHETAPVPWTTAPTIGIPWHGNTTTVFDYDEATEFDMASNKVMPYHQPMIEVKGYEIHVKAVETIPMTGSNSDFAAQTEHAKEVCLFKVQHEAISKNLAILTKPLVTVWDDSVNFTRKVQVEVIAVHQIEYPNPMEGK